MAVLYQKVLRQSGPSRQAIGAGTISNYLSNDAARIWKLPENLHALWASPLQVTVLLAVLSLMLTVPAAAAALGVTLVCLLLCAGLGSVQLRLRKRQLYQTDKRARLISEILSGIKAIKLYAWEGAFLKRIEEVRAAELRFILK